LAQHFQGKSVTIIPDNDSPGQAHAIQVASSLWQKAKSIKVLNLPNLPDKGDVSDWIAAGGTREELLALAAQHQNGARLLEIWKQGPLVHCAATFMPLKMALFRF